MDGWVDGWMPTHAFGSRIGGPLAFQTASTIKQSEVATVVRIFFFFFSN